MKLQIVDCGAVARMTGDHTFITALSATRNIGFRCAIGGTKYPAVADYCKKNHAIFLITQEDTREE